MTWPQVQPYEYLEDALDVVKLPAARLQQDSRSVGYLVEILAQSRAVLKIDSVMRFNLKATKKEGNSEHLHSTGCPFLLVGWVDYYLKDLKVQGV